MRNQLDPEDFYGCYLLASLKENCKNHAYIGFTVDPAKRIRQHNGEIEGGAKKTSFKRPWEMVLSVYGFPSQVAALRFEWAWQNPKESLITRDVASALRAVGRQEQIPCKIRVLYEILSVPPFSRFPLQIAFFTQAYHVYLKGCPPPPRHMSVRVLQGGPGELYRYDPSHLLPRPLHAVPMQDDDLASLCDLCKMPLFERGAEHHEEHVCPLGCSHVECVHDDCFLRSHVKCLALHMLKEQGEDAEELVPTWGKCPICQEKLVWGEIVAEKQKRKRVCLERANITL